MRNEHGATTVYQAGRNPKPGEMICPNCLFGIITLSRAKIPATLYDECPHCGWDLQRAIHGGNNREPR